ncbi:MAG TPA: branched-chain amino acid ABC transporter permease [Bacillota bacterium]|jgi:branched-chain amino acid transport system permease protein
MQESLSMLPQVIIDGLTLGFVYALVALGYTMVYGVLEFINFAHSEIFMIGAFAGTEALLILQSSGLLAAMPAFVSLIIALLFAMAFAGAVAAGMERVAYRPLRGASRLVPLISAIGVSFFLQDAVRLFEGLWRNAFYLSTPVLYRQTLGLSSLVDLPVKTIILVAVCLAIMFGLTAFVNRTRMGRALRAVAQDQATASLLGVNVNVVITLTFLIGGALGGAAGVLFAMQYTLIHPYVGFILGIKAFTAAVFGGIGSIPGAMLGGVLLGLIESLGSAYLGVFTRGAFGAEYKDVIAFVILILVLILKPSGLLGETVHEKA